MSVLHAATVPVGSARATTTMYQYQVLDHAAPLLEFHYHPGETVDFCHIHVAHNPRGWEDFHKVHVPSGRVSLEDVILMLVDDFPVRIKRGGRAVLEANRAEFESNLTWSGRRSRKA